MVGSRPYVSALQGNDGNFARLVTGQVLYQGPVDLSQYYIQSYSMTDDAGQLLKAANGHRGIKVEIRLSRRLLSHVLTTFLPTAAICVVSYSTHYFRPTNFTPIITVNLTSLLVLTTLFIGISKSLPDTAYVKMIDIWLIFNLFLPFTEVVLHTIADVLRVREERRVFGDNYDFGRQYDPGTDEDANKGRVGNGSAWPPKPNLKGRRYSSRSLTIVRLIGKIGLPLIFISFCGLFLLVGISLREKKQQSLD